MREEIKTFLTTIENSSDAIIFYKELRAALKENLNPDVKNKLTKRIKAYKQSYVITLNLLHEPLTKHKPNYLVLAAASEEVKTPKLVTKTFVDDKKEYLIKVLNYGNTSKVFVFSTQDEIVKDFNIVIEPQHLKFHLDDNSEPLKVDNLLEVEQIHIEF